MPAYDGFDVVMRNLREGYTNRVQSILARGEINIYENGGELLKFIRESSYNGYLSRYQIRQLYDVLINSYSYKVNKNDPMFIQSNMDIREVVNIVSNTLTMDNRLLLESIRGDIEEEEVESIE